MDYLTSRNARLLSGLISLLFLAACVGPTTPLGAVDHTSSDSSTEEPADDGEYGSTTGSGSQAQGETGIFFSPSYQQVNGPYSWRVLVIDPSGMANSDPSSVRVFYNGMDVSEAANLQFKTSYGKTSDGKYEVLVFTMPHLRLDAMKDHAITVHYRTLRGDTMRARYRFPTVENIEAIERFGDTDPFTVESQVLGAIAEASIEYRINPVLLAALIAQESGFDPYALSRARALGLTQVTHLAERDIIKNFSYWPRYPSIQKLSRRRLRNMIPEIINSSNEWRLDPVKSVWGGAYYLGYLKERLRDEDNLPLVMKTGHDENRAITEVSLAAYNSGINRVLDNIGMYGDEWLEHRETREAKRYIRKVLSYYGAFKRSDEVEYTTTGGSR